MESVVRKIENKVMSGQSISFEEAIQLAQVEDVEGLFAAANRIRQKFKGNRVDLCTIMNAKSGRCPENCKFCAQSAHYRTGVQEYPLISVEEALRMAKENEMHGVHRFSLVTSGKALSKKEFDRVIEIYKVLRQKTKLQLCASLGIISHDQAVRLKEAGVTMYHHNLETSRDYFHKICDTHTYQDRIDTVKNAMAAGLDVCCGGIIGMGESMEDRIKMAFEIKELGVRSVPVNILNPIKGTPLENAEKLNPIEILKTMSIFRFIIPDGFIRYAGGRNTLGGLQRLGFNAGINAALVGNYLTTVGNSIPEDIAIIKEEGLEV
ncbi:MAG: biotin synthase [Thermosediminibacterales bacterium]|nr:biotin synthase [Thermosediminibacterales bacterium]MDK2835756.1 biotin synthase [Thermosediminibacterales bacterium]